MVTSLNEEHAGSICCKQIEIVQGRGIVDPSPESARRKWFIAIFWPSRNLPSPFKSASERV
jgi:hypothetical protein